MMSSSKHDELLGERHIPEERSKNWMFQNAKKLGFSQHEISHLKRLYAGTAETKSK